MAADRSRRLFDETDNTNFLLITFIYLMVTNVYPMVAEKSRLANPQKNENNYEKIRKMEKDGLATLLLPMNYLIPWYYRGNLFNW
jgi:hypothetical protein